MSERTLSPAPVDYPSGDGNPLAENDWQLRAIFDSFAALDHHFRDRADVYVSSDLLIYYEEGNPRARAAPDVFVVFGVPGHKRPIYKLWEEGVAPAFVLEVASRGTWREDEGRKARLYEELGVREYFQHDPTGEHLGLRLKGRRLVRGAYEPLTAVEYLDGGRLLRSDTLGLDVRARGEEIRFLEPGSGRPIPLHAELDAARQAAESRADDERSRADAERSRAEAERARADAAEARIAELEALLGERRG